MLLSSARRRRAPDHTRSLKGVLDEDAFGAVLRRERDRADRTRGVFTLVSLDLGDEAFLQASWLRRLGRTLRARLRSTDEAGWLPNNRLGLSLPHTDEDGAWTLTHALSSELERRPLPAPLRFNVYSYRKDDGDDLEDERERSVAVGPSQAGRGPSDAAPTLSMEPFFFEPPTRVKRAFDVVLGGAGLVLSAPVIAAAAVAIKATSPGPVLFRQTRAGYGGRPFELYKLRTMVEGADDLKITLSERNEADGPVFKMKEDPRVTPVGRFLRRLSIDEMPQFWNVIRGEMSIVGPRPPTLDEIDHYASWQRRRLYGIGGLTCFWQVAGRSNIGFLDWVRLDLRYLRRRNLLMDLVLILKTIPAVLGGRGAR